MILDGHIHIRTLNYDREKFLQQLSQAGVEGGIIILSLPTRNGNSGKIGAIKVAGAKTFTPRVLVQRTYTNSIK